jgi:hypothetical protein
MGEPRIEEVGDHRHTYLFFEFCDELPCEVVLRFLSLLLILALIFLRLAKRQWIRNFVINIECIDGILSPDRLAFALTIERSSTGKFLPGSLEH